jgi:hypothetical protein
VCAGPGRPFADGALRGPTLAAARRRAHVALAGRRFDAPVWLRPDGTFFYGEHGRGIWQFREGEEDLYVPTPPCFEYPGSIRWDGEGTPHWTCWGAVWRGSGERVVTGHALIAVLPTGYAVVQPWDGSWTDRAALVDRSGREVSHVVLEGWRPSSGAMSQGDAAWVLWSRGVPDEWQHVLVTRVTSDGSWDVVRRVEVSTRVSSIVALSDGTVFETRREEAAGTPFLVRHDAAGGPPVTLRELPWWAAGGFLLGPR